MSQPGRVVKANSHIENRAEKNASEKSPSNDTFFGALKSSFRQEALGYVDPDHGDLLKVQSGRSRLV